MSKITHYDNHPQFIQNIKTRWMMPPSWILPQPVLSSLSELPMNRNQKYRNNLQKREKALALLQNINEEVKVLNHLLKKMQVDIASGDTPISCRH